LSKSYLSSNEKNLDWEWANRQRNIYQKNLSS